MRRMRALTNTVIPIVVALSVLCCNKSEAPKPAAKKAPAAEPTPAADPAPAADPTPVAPAAARLNLLDLSVAVPAGWVAEQPRSRMRVAQFRLPGAGAKDAELTVIAAGGGVDANIARWKGQFQGEAAMTRREVDAGGLKVTEVRLDGTFMYKARPMAPGPGTPHPDYAVIGAIVKTPKAQLFFKAFGPKATIDAHAAAFSKMMAGCQTTGSP